MGGLKAVSDYEELRKARISENQARLASLGIQKSVSEFRSLKRAHVRKWCKVDYSSGPLRRSPRLSGSSRARLASLSIQKSVSELRSLNSSPKSERTHVRKWCKVDYEELRNARISENQARLASLGIHKSASELRSLNSSLKSERTHVRKRCKVDYSSGPLRRSSRLSESSRARLASLSIQKSVSELRSLNSSPKSERTHVRKRCKVDYSSSPLRRSSRLCGSSRARLASFGIQKSVSELRSLNSSPKSERIHVRKRCKVDYSSGPLPRSSRLSGSSRGEISYLECSDVKIKGRGKRGFGGRQISEVALARRCESKSRGSLYDPTYGITCHFCRQKKLCGEEDCKRCGNLDMDEPCIGKTDCSICHSSNGILCRACLKVRYGEEMEDARANKEWICPHCTEDKGIIPYWICNSSICLTRRKMIPTGIAIFRARKMGFKSVAHLLMNELRRADKRR